MRPWLPLIGCLMLPWASATALEDFIATRSRGSGQFIVHGQKPPISPGYTSTANPFDNRPVTLDPALVVISCDRIKQALLKELDGPDRWRSKIHVYLSPAQAKNSSAIIQSEFYLDRWQGRVTVATELEPGKFIRGIVYALLLEIANRVPGQYVSELPLWLVEGLSQVLWERYGTSLLLEAQTRLFRMTVNTDPFVGLRSRIQQMPPLSFQELGLPEPGLVQGEAWPRYQDSACLMVLELSRLPGGRQALRSFLETIPSHLNWQTAFYRAFPQYFQRPLDVEKWWSLTAATVAGRGPGLTLPLDRCLEKLDEILHVPIQTRQASDRIPVPSQVSLQQFVAQWNLEVQRVLLPHKIGQLQLLRQEAPPEAIPLLDSYLALLTHYLQQRQSTSLTPGAKGSGPASPPLLIQLAVDRLNALDQKRRDKQDQARTTPTPPSNNSTTAR